MAVITLDLCAIDATEITTSPTEALNNLRDYVAEAIADLEGDHEIVIDARASGHHSVRLRIDDPADLEEKIRDRIGRAGVAWTLSHTIRTLDGAQAWLDACADAGVQPWSEAEVSAETLRDHDIEASWKPGDPPYYVIQPDREGIPAFVVYQGHVIAWASDDLLMRV